MMANTSLGTLAISMTLWLADLGAAHVQPPAPSPPAKTCQPGAQAPGDADSDLEVVVCAKRIQR